LSKPQTQVIREAENCHVKEKHNYSLNNLELPLFQNLKQGLAK
jgi:hypothetical protein